MKKCLVCAVGKDDKENLIVYDVMECNRANASNHLYCDMGNHGFIVHNDKIVECKNVTFSEAYSLARELKMIDN